MCLARLPQNRRSPRALVYYWKVKASLQTDCPWRDPGGHFHSLQFKILTACWQVGPHTGNRELGREASPFCPGFPPAVGGHPIAGWGRNTKCIVVLLGTSHLFLIKEAAEQTLLPSCYSSRQPVAVEPSSPQPGLEHPPCRKALVTHTPGSFWIPPFGKAALSGPAWLFSPDLPHLAARRGASPDLGSPHIRGAAGLWASTGDLGRASPSVRVSVAPQMEGTGTPLPLAQMSPLLACQKPGHPVEPPEVLLTLQATRSHCMPTDPALRTGLRARVLIPVFPVLLLWAFTPISPTPHSLPGNLPRGHPGGLSLTLLNRTWCPSPALDLVAPAPENSGLRSRP